ncbi:TetR/AcrR family transcriptional regulator [Hoyosella rhizosphaerae]|uniref:Transcriptional regulator n=1 Tax=Hoyosella rhizosphaerae TaxID=1755582 RepID=A0A916UL60_9ACTN|nr:TetR/AcrR family transcriptional regulator [Hoyosella rhizosphaerae]MBN4925468.1 TetR/AcrR family transcriptional regulator [Hoyosella rhizosphaerae]GGC74942.1 transcriptional regulator [Hoyosella rhizosphaerae]
MTPTELSPRAREIVDCAHQMLNEHGWDHVSMRDLATELGIKAPSLYKHFANRDALKTALLVDALTETGTRLHRALENDAPALSLLREYRMLARERPHLYRLATQGTLPRADLPEGLEEWAGAPFFLATGNEHKAQALWSFAHGMAILEIDGRYPPGSDLDKTWDTGAQLFSRH